jgi:crossover junction endodeoxyribonuclease RuvC
MGMGVLKLKSLSDPQLKYEKILQTTLSLIDQYNPDELAIEAPFYGKNIQSMLKLGRAQGLAIAAALLRKIPIFEYPPRRVKQSITGKGGASKEQVAAMLKQFFKFEETPEEFDATDAIAIALCHYFQRSPVKNPRYKGWQGFISDNPGRVVR